MLLKRKEGAKGSVVFVHPAGSAGEIWKDDVEYFSRWYNTLTMDLPGRGVTGGEGSSDIFEYARFVKNVIDMAGLSSAVVAGMSMGGAVAQALALEHPEVVSGLVLVGTGAKLPCSPAIFESITGDYSKYLDMSGELAYGANADKGIIERHRSIAISVRPEVVFGDFTACNTFDSRNRLDEIKVPTLIMCGEADFFMPLKFSAYLAENIVDSRLVTFPNIGHFVMAEAQEEFRRYMLEFLGRVF